MLYPVPQGLRRFILNSPLSDGDQLIDDPQISVVRYPAPRWRKSSSDSLLSIGKYGALEIEKIEGANGRTDVLLAEGWSAAIWATELGRRVKLPVVIVEHSNSLINPALQKDIFIRERYFGAVREAAHFCVVSPALRRWVLAMCEDNTELDPIVVGDLVDTDFFIPCRNKRPSGRFEIVTVTSKSQQKDVGTFIRAIAHARSIKAHFVPHAWIVGLDEETKRNYDQLCLSLGVSDIVEIGQGRWSRSDVLRAIQRADVFVSSSISETFGIAIAEALACGVRVAATRSGGAEFILGEDSPFLVEVRDPVALASKIIEIAHGTIPFNPHHSRKTIIQRFGEEAFLARMMKILESAINMHKKGH
jgi:glycosyltransferase involved in cell wall biosynthesis